MTEKTITIWSDPRWKVLFDVTKLNRVKPWQIRLVEVIRDLMEELERRNIIDLNSCGVAACSAATIHRMKTELLLKADKPRAIEEGRDKELLMVPPPLDLPCMPEFMVVAMNELIRALKEVFDRSSGRSCEEEKAHFMVLDIKVDDFLVKIEERLEEFLEGMRRIFGDRELVDFREIFRNADRLEAARRLILLLFAASKGIIQLVEDDEHKLVAVRWNGGSRGAKSQN